MNFKRIWFKTGRRLALLLLAMILMPHLTLAKTLKRPAHQVIWRSLGGNSWHNWSGVTRIGTTGVGTVGPTDKATFIAPATPGPDGWYKQGFGSNAAGQSIFCGWYGLECQVKLPSAGATRMVVELSIPRQTGRESLISSTRLDSDTGRDSMADRDSSMECVRFATGRACYFALYPRCTAAIPVHQRAAGRCHIDSSYWFAAGDDTSPGIAGAFASGTGGWHCNLSRDGVQLHPSVAKRTTADSAKQMACHGGDRFSGLSGAAFRRDRERGSHGESSFGHSGGRF